MGQRDPASAVQTDPVTHSREIWVSSPSPEPTPGFSYVYLNFLFIFITLYLPCVHSQVREQLQGAHRVDPGNQSFGRLGDKYPLLPDRLTCPLPKLSDLIRQAVVGCKYIIKLMVRARQTALAR